MSVSDVTFKLLLLCTVRVDTKHKKINTQPEVGTVSVITITLRYVFALSYNVLTLWRSVIASITYRSEHIGAVIPSYSCHSNIINQRYRHY